MEYTKLGNTGMDVSRICLGCMGFGDPTRCAAHAYDRQTPAEPSYAELS